MFIGMITTTMPVIAVMTLKSTATMITTAAVIAFRCKGKFLCEIEWPRLRRIGGPCVLGPIRPYGFKDTAVRGLIRRGLADRETTAKVGA